jgi:hypothetical protein
MRTLAAVLLLAALWFTLPARPTPATAQEKPGAPRWEYAELSYRGNPGRPAFKDKDGNEQPATPGTMAVRWTTGAEEVSVKGWDELGEKLKVEVKKDASASQHKIQAMNALGAAGWELVSQEAAAPVAVPTGPGTGGFGPRPVTSTTWVFKRRVP